MKVQATRQKQNRFADDFKSVLVFSLIANAKKLKANDLKVVNECIGKKRMGEALRIVERKYSPREWREYVEAQARPLLNGYLQEIVSA